MSGAGEGDAEIRSDKVELGRETPGSERISEPRSDQSVILLHFKQENAAMKRCFRERGGATAM